MRPKNNRAKSETSEIWLVKMKSKWIWGIKEFSAYSVDTPCHYLFCWLGNGGWWWFDIDWWCGFVNYCWEDYGKWMRIDLLPFCIFVVSPFPLFNANWKSVCAKEKEEFFLEIVSKNFLSYFGIWPNAGSDGGWRGVAMAMRDARSRCVCERA